MSAPWTEEETEILKKLHGQGKTFPEISTMLRRAGYQQTADGCRQKAGRLGLKPRVLFGWTEEEDDILRELHAKGWTFAEIATRLNELGFNRKRNACIGRATRIGLAPRLSERRKDREAGIPGRPRAPRKSKVKKQAPPPEDLKPIGPVGKIPDGHVCKYVYGDPLKPGWRMCGHKAMPGKSWCETHYAVVMENPEQQEQRETREKTWRSKPSHIANSRAA